jgi:hypothetical protein
MYVLRPAECYDAFSDSQSAAQQLAVAERRPPELHSLPTTRGTSQSTHARAANKSACNTHIVYTCALTHCALKHRLLLLLQLEDALLYGTCHHKAGGADGLVLQGYTDKQQQRNRVMSMGLQCRPCNLHIYAQPQCGPCWWGCA